MECTRAELDDPARASATFTGFTGETTFERSVDQFLCTDLVLHRWDLAQANGDAVRLDPSEMSHVRAAMGPLADKMRSPGAFGPELNPPDGSDEQTRFLAYFGRRC